MGPGPGRMRFGDFGGRMRLQVLTGDGGANVVRAQGALHTKRGSDDTRLKFYKVVTLLTLLLGSENWTFNKITGQLYSSNRNEISHIRGKICSSRSQKKCRCTAGDEYYEYI